MPSWAFVHHGISLQCLDELMGWCGPGRRWRCPLGKQDCPKQDAPGWNTVAGHENGSGPSFCPGCWVSGQAAFRGLKPASLQWLGQGGGVNASYDSILSDYTGMAPPSPLPPAMSEGFRVPTIFSTFVITNFSNVFCCCCLLKGYKGHPSWLSGKQLAKQETGVQSLDQEDPLEKEMAIRSSILAWEIPWTEEPGGLQSMRSQKSQTQLSN